MGIIDGRTWTEDLSPSECWNLLSMAPVGRIGVLLDGTPEIYPVNFVIDDQSIVFRTDPGNKLRGLNRNPAVCFEADGINMDDHTGWSVLVKGRAAELHGDQELRRAAELPLRVWALGEKGVWIHIRPTEVTGRKLWQGHTSNADW